MDPGLIDQHRHLGGEVKEGVGSLHGGIECLGRPADVALDELEVLGLGMPPEKVQILPAALA